MEKTSKYNLINKGENEMKTFRKDYKTIKDLKRQRQILMLSLAVLYIDGSITKEDHIKKASRVEKAYFNTLKSWQK